MSLTYGLFPLALQVAAWLLWLYSNKVAKYAWVDQMCVPQVGRERTFDTTFALLAMKKSFPKTKQNDKPGPRSP